MYTEKQIRDALELFDLAGSITTVIRQLGYPSRTMLYNWLKTRGTNYRTPKEKRKCCKAVGCVTISRSESALARCENSIETSCIYEVNPLASRSLSCLTTSLSKLVSSKITESI